jgi:hypothetical protein
VSTFDDQLEKVRTAAGFIAALDQSGGSTPKALEQYGIPKDAWSGDDEMFDLVHEMRTRIVTSPAFGGDRRLPWPGRLSAVHLGLSWGQQAWPVKWDRPLDQCFLD